MVANNKYIEFELQALTEEEMGTQSWQQKTKTNSCGDTSNPKFL